MPHLQFELNFDLSAAEKRALADAVVRRFSEIMDTGTDHVAVTIRTFAHADLTFGRASPSGGRTAFVNADIRRGRTREQKRRLSLAYVDELHRRFGLAPEAVYLVLTEHDGENFQLSDRVLPSWTSGENTFAAPKAGAGARKASRPGRATASTRPAPRRRARR